MYATGETHVGPYLLDAGVWQTWVAWAPGNPGQNSSRPCFPAEASSFAREMSSGLKTSRHQSGAPLADECI